MAPVLLNPHRFASSPGFLAEFAADNPSVWWRQDDASGTVMTDYSGNARHGAYVNSPTLGQPGPLSSSPGTAALYNGTTQYGTIANSGWMNSLGALTLAAWIKTTATSGTIIGRATVAGPYRLGVSAGKAFIEVRDSGGALLISSTTSVNDNTWRYITGRWSGATLFIDVDGVPEVNAAKSGTLVAVSQPLRVAQRNSDSFFAGTVAHAGLFPTNIGPTRVAAHYAGR